MEAVWSKETADTYPDKRLSLLDRLKNIFTGGHRRRHQSAMSCYGCACDHCLYNAELEAWYMTPGEVQNAEDICFCCDECKHYDGDFSKRSQWRPDCQGTSSRKSTLRCRG